MNQKQIENHALIVTTIVNAIITAAGIWMYFLTDLQVMFLDGFFSLIALVSTIAAVLISILSKKSTRSYPHGLYHLEPLYAVMKAILMIVLMVVALIEAGQVAIDYFIYGKGEVMNTTPLPFYAVLMTVLCLGLAFFNRRQYKRTNCTSTMLRSESQTNLIDGLQSAGIGVAIVILRMLPIDSAFGFLHYTGDFFIALVVTIASIKEPIVIFFDAFRELTGGQTKDKAIIQAVSNATGLAASQFEVYKIGMKIKVRIPARSKDEIDISKKEQSLLVLRHQYECAEIEYVI